MNIEMTGYRPHLKISIFSFDLTFERMFLSYVPRTLAIYREFNKSV